MEKNNMAPKELMAARRLLMFQWSAYVALPAAAVLAYETQALAPGAWADNAALQYNLLMAMELLTICCIPSALKMFSVKCVKSRLRSGGSRWLKLFGTLRLGMLGVPLLLNTFLYYQFMAVAFAYMAIIGLLCMSFVYPGQGRCQDETQSEK